MNKLILAAVATALTAGTCFAQGYPTKPISLIVPFAAGGSSDLIARAVAKKATTFLGQPIVVVNKPGGSTNIGLSELVEAAPDGYTIGTVSPAMTQQFLTGNSRYDYVDKLAPVAQVSNIPYVLAVGSGLPYKTLKEFVDYAKAHPDEIKYGTAGAVSATYSSFARFAIDTGIKIGPVHFDGGSRAIAAMLGGHVQASWQGPSDFRANVLSGGIRPLAVAGEKRIFSDPAYKDVPTFREQGFEVIDSLWTGIAAPKGIPADVTAKLEGAMKKIVDDAETRAAIERIGLQPDYLPAADFGSKWQSQQESFKRTLQLISGAK